MVRIVFFFLLSLGLLHPVFSQTPDARQYEVILARNIGNAKKIMGVTAIVPFWIEFADRPFGEQQEADLWSSMSTVARYFLSISIFCGHYRSQYDVYPNPIPHITITEKAQVYADDFPYNLVPRSVMDSVHHSFMKSNFFENIVYVFFVNDTGKVFTIPAFDEHTLEYSLVNVDMGLKNWIKYDELANVLAHEFLHQFGAIDLYYPRGKGYLDRSSNLWFIKDLVSNYSWEERAAMEVAFRSSIMTTEAVFPSGVVVAGPLDPVTRYLIGLTDTLEKRFWRLLDEKG
ncbi:MAG: hypothetical protein ACK5XP_06225 [Sphingobacteriia bacterium]